MTAKKHTPNEFTQQYLARTGSGHSGPRRAAEGTLPDRLYPDELAQLMAPVSPKVIAALEFAIAHGDLPATLKHVPPGIGASDESRRDLSKHHRWLIHRDDARRYFRSLDLMPEEGSPLWHWLTASRDDTAQQAQSEDDYRAALAEIWGRSPMTRIGDFGDGHILDQIRGFGGITMQRRKALAKEVAKVHADPTVLRTGRTPKAKD